MDDAYVYATFPGARYFTVKKVNDYLVHQDSVKPETKV